MPINSFLYPGAKFTPPYEVANSCRFNAGDSPKLVKAQTTASNRDKWTWSCWFKLADSSSDRHLFAVGDPSGNHSVLYMSSTGIIRFYEDPSALCIFYASQFFRDPSAWYHFMLVYDSTESTDTNRLKMYVNGVQVTAFSSTTYPALNRDSNMGESGEDFRIGCNLAGSGAYWSGYMAEVVFCDGQAYTASDFGEFDEDSPTIWKPKDVSGLTFGNNGFYLDFEDSSNLGNDANGGTDFTETNLAATDQATDTPTNNFCTMNPLENYYNQSTFSEGNLQVAVGSSQYSYNLSTIGVSSGKWYCEMKCTSVGSATNDIAFGISSTQPVSSTQVIGYHPNDVAYRGSGDKKINNSDTSYGDTFSTNDIISIALNLDDNEVKFYKNGTVQNSGTAISITAPASTGLGNYFFTIGYINTAATATFQTNFGNPPYANSSSVADENGYGAFEYAPPSGFLALCTKNLGSDGG